jgi:predicted  nucleic acid-binding Zn-ribbon protein
VKRELGYWHECISCGHQFKPDKFLYTCPNCSGLLLVVRDDEAIEKLLGKGQKAKNYMDNLRFGSS